MRVVRCHPQAHPRTAPERWCRLKTYRPTATAKSAVSTACQGVPSLAVSHEMYRSISLDRNVMDNSTSGVVGSPNGRPHDGGSSHGVRSSTRATSARRDPRSALASRPSSGATRGGCSGSSGSGGYADRDVVVGPDFELLNIVVGRLPLGCGDRELRTRRRIPRVGHSDDGLYRGAPQRYGRVGRVSRRDQSVERRVRSLAALSMLRRFGVARSRNQRTSRLSEIRGVRSVAVEPMTGGGAEA